MVVIVRDRSPLLAVLIAIVLIVMVVVGIIVFLLTRGTVLVVAIPGFPAESIILGLALGLLLIALKRRRPARKAR